MITDRKASHMTSLRKALKLEGGGIISLVGAGGKTTLLFRLARELSRNGDSVLTTTTTRICTPDPPQTGEVLIATSVADLLNRAEVCLRRHHHLTAAAGVEDQGKLIGLSPGMVDALANAGLFRWVIVEADGAAGRPLKAPAAHEPVIPPDTGWLVGMVGLSAVGKPLNARWVHRPELLSERTGLSMEDEITAPAVARLLRHPLGTLKDAPRGCRKLIFLNQADRPGGIAAGRRICDSFSEEPLPGLERIMIGQLLSYPPVLASYDPAEAEDGQPIP